MPEPTQAALARFQTENWEETIERVTAFAVAQVRSRVWRGASGGPIPGGIEPEDIVYEAVLGVIAGDWAWEPAKRPDLGHHLKGIVRSLVAQRVRLLENRNEIDPTLLADRRDDEGNAADEPLARVADGRPAAADLLVEEDDALAFAATLADDPVAEKVFWLAYNGASRDEIARRLGVSPMTVTNARKRLHRRLVAFLPMRGGAEHGREPVPLRVRKGGKSDG